MMFGALLMGCLKAFVLVVQEGASPSKLHWTSALCSRRERSEGPGRAALACAPPTF